MGALLGDSEIQVSVRTKRGFLNRLSVVSGHRFCEIFGHSDPPLIRGPVTKGESGGLYAPAAGGRERADGVQRRRPPASADGRRTEAAARGTPQVP